MTSTAPAFGSAEVGGSSATEVELFTLSGAAGQLREVNEAFAQLLGLPPAELDARPLLELVHPADRAGVTAGLAALEAGAGQVAQDNRFLQRDGGTVHLAWVARPLPGTDAGWAAGSDSGEFHRLLAQRLVLRARLELALGQITAALWDLDMRTGRFSWEPQAAQVLGVDVASVPADVDALAATVHPQDADAARSAVAQLTDTGLTEVGLRVGRDAGLRHLSLRGKVLDRDRRGQPVRAVGLVLDVTAEKAMEEQMLRMVMSDALTGVPNRRAFDQALRSESRRCTREGQPLSVVMVDIDNFKRFNDTYGHLVGDEALCSVGRALTRTLNRAGDMLARFGGEEFALVLPGTDGDGARDIAHRLVHAVRAVTVRQAPDWDFSVSVGTASWHPDSPAVKPTQLLTQADQALYAAKTAGKNRAHSYQPPAGNPPPPDDDLQPDPARADAADVPGRNLQRTG